MQTLTIFLQVYVIADKYDISALAELAKNKFEELVAPAWNDPSFLPALRIIDEETSDRAMKDNIIKAVTAHIDKFLAKKEFTDLCESNAALTLEILTKLGSTPPPQALKVGDPCRKCGSGLCPDPTADDITGYMCVGCGTQVEIEAYCSERDERVLDERFLMSR